MSSLLPPPPNCCYRHWIPTTTLKAEMSPYNAPLNDIAFALRHIAGLDELAQLPAWSDIGLDHTEVLLAEAGRLASEVVAPTNRIGA
ncbi:MAG: hypothetical protein F4153_11025, partial [Acidimicrobiia bacterium]|nr:hypothetical protein [Acidimicrobiia bacterium]